MAVDLVTVTGNLETLAGAAPLLGRVWFRISRADWTLSGEIFAPEYVEVIADAVTGAFSVDLQSTDDFEAGSTYAAVLKYREPLDAKDREFTIGTFALPSGGPYQLGDLMSVPVAAPVPADVLALCQAYAAATAADRIQTGLDRTAAEASAARIDLGELDDAVAATAADAVATGANAVSTAADRAAVTPLAAQVVIDAAAVAANAVIVAADKAAIAADRVLAETAAANAQASAYTVATWAALSAITGTAAGQGAEVLDADAGTHTDPVVGGTVANAGRFTWSASPAGWKWIGATGLAGKASKTSVDQELLGQVVGTSAAASGSVGSNNSFYYWPGTQKTYDQLLTQIEIGVNAARVIQIPVARVEGDGSLTLVSMNYGTTAVGANTLTMNVFVPAGCVIGIGNMGAFYFDATTGVPLWNTAAAPTTSTAKTIGTTTNIHHKLTLIGATAARAKVGLDGAVAADAEVGVDVHGLAPIASGSTANNATCYFWPDGIKSYDQALTRVEVAVTTARTAAILVAQVNGDGTLTLVNSTPITLAAGVNSVAAQVFVPAGCIVGLGNLGTYYYSVIAPICWTTAATPATSTAKTISTTNAANMRLTLAANTKAKAELGYASAAATAAVIGAVASVGWPSLVATGSNAPAYTVIPQTPAPADGRVTRVQVASNAGGAARIFACTIGAGPIATITAYQDVTLAAGLNDIPVTIPITAGQYAGIYAAGTVGLKFQNSTNPLGIAYWYQTALPAGSAVITSTSHRFELALTIKTGLQAGSGAALPTGSGLDYFEAADKTGVTDATALFATAKSGHPAPYVPPGDYAVTALPASGGGLWGPGRPFVNGTRFFLPAQPRVTTLLTALRSAFAEHIAAGDVLTLIGDSISHWSAATTGAAHWFNRFTAFANLGIAADQPIMTALRSSSTYTPAFYGLTVSGGTGGTIGPLGESLILAAADYIEFTGAYEQIDVFAKQVAGAGTLSITYNGGAAFGTKSYAGATTLDVISGFPATGQVASGTYRITASVGPVELTGLIRLGVNASTTAVAPRRLRTMRAAHGSYTFANFNPTATASILAQAAHAGGKCVPIIALGINDSFGTAPGTIITNATALLDNLEAGGVTRMFGILPMRPSSGWNASYTGGRTFDAAIGPLRALYRSRGVTILPVDALDWVNEGLLSDGLHPNDLGNDRLASLVVEALAP